MTNNHLAIVIPAYKSTFLNETLKSISLQTCKKFKLYIGDDNSPYSLEPIVQQWENTMDIKYQKFESNIGGNNLIAQWERCIDMTNGEEWIWLFSDDDIMSPNCVENFYKYLYKDNGPQFFHFDTVLIDDYGNILKPRTKYPSILSCGGYIDLCFQWKDRTNGVSFIFNKQHFLKINKFEYFDLAWGSDQATWIKLAKDNGIFTIPDTVVYWRYGNSSISSDWNIEISRKKKNAFLSFLKWRQKYCIQNSIVIRTTSLLKSIYLIRNIRHYRALTYKEKKHFLYEGLKILSCGLFYYYISYLILFVLFPIIELKRSVSMKH